MPITLLWAVDVYGRVYSLSTASGRWQRGDDKLLELKRVSAGKGRSWGVGCDHHVYLNLMPSETPIRFREETYENQRWNPVEGFTDVLLPTDRWPWSDVTGVSAQPLHSFACHSHSWEWEGDWYVDLTCGGEPSQTGGWEYAVDFPANFSPEKKWNSCVRRRRWIRYRRYTAQGSWAKIPLDQPQKAPLPLCDISCGGWEMSDQSGRYPCLWGVSQQGQVWFREGIQPRVPEGSSWEEVGVPKEVAQLCAGPGDLLWALLWDGNLLVRMGLSLDSPTGSSWVEVETPGKEVEALHVAVGVSVVWVVTKDFKVWFRRGVNSHNPCGSGWISIGGEMMMVDVGLHDQVVKCFADMRVSPPSVTKFRITLQLTYACALFYRDDFGGCLTEASQGSVLSCTDSESEVGPVDQPTHTTDTAATLDPPEASTTAPAETLSTPPPATQDAPKSPAAAPRSRSEAPPGEGGGEPLSSAGAAPSSSPNSTTPLQTLGSGSEAGGGAGAAATYPLGLDPLPGAGESDAPVWAWISGGGCDVDASSLISWLSPTGRDERNSMSVWIRSGALRWWRDWKPQRWVDVSVALEQSTDCNGRKDCIFFIYYTQYDEKKYLHVFVSEVTAMVPVLGDCHHAFSVYTAQRTRRRGPLLLAAPTDQDMTDWLSLLSQCCCEWRGIRGPPSRQALWSTTSKGDIMVHEPSTLLETTSHPLACEAMFWRLVPGHLRCVQSNSLGLVWGIGWDGTAWVYSQTTIPGNLALSFKALPYPQTDVRCIHVYENQRWNPMAGYTDRGLPTDRPMWSDESGLKEGTKASTPPPSPQWSWVTEWVVDYSVPGGADKDGWQYAADFPVYVVERARESLKCKITLRAHWQQVPPIRLSDISLMPCLAQSRMEQVPVWALSDKGDVLCRLGVTPKNPAGTSWLHVGTDQPFKSISIGGANQVWAIAKDGAVFYRGSVSPQNPAGECWYHIPSPPRQTLRQLSVGRTSVFAVDESSNLWYRQGLTPSYPQGSAWELISNNVTKVSVGPLDQVWAVADGVEGFPAEAPGTLCHRVGVGPMQPKGHSWDYGIGGGWEYISVRGNATEPARTIVPAAIATQQSPLPPPTRENGSAVGV
uniref:Tectonin beta-propeller repeat containing 1 n=1 Tax=Gadus morhua TaxID=8049 RepID=A0A8C5BK61_GADMO